MQNEKTNPWVIAFRVIFTIALVACIAFIFHNSLEAGALSSARSQAIIRKLAHFAEFTLEGFLLMLCLRVYTARFVRHISWPLLGGMSTALMDETIQRFIPGRSSQVTDVWIDMGGVVFGALVALVVLLIVRALMAFHHIKKENRRLRAEREELLRQQEEDRLDAAPLRNEQPDRRDLL